MSQVSEGDEIALDRASNIKIFEKIAVPHMIDSRRIERLKQFNQVSDLPIGRPVRSHPQYTVEAEEDSDPSQAEEVNDDDEDEGHGFQVHPAVAALAGQGDNDSLAAILRDGMRGAAASPPSSEARSSPVEAAVIAAMRPPSRSGQSRRSSAQSQGYRIAPSPPMPSPPAMQSAMQPMMQPTMPPAMQPMMQPMMPFAHEMDELARIQASAEGGGPSLGSMRMSYRSRQSGEAPPEAPPPGAGASSYMQTFRNLCQSRRTVLEGDAPQSGGYKPHKDADYAEKRELLVKLDEMRALGFNVPRFALEMPLEDLQSELARRTVSQGTVSTVETMCGWLCTAASIIETVNAMAGPFLPMENYAQQVKEGTSTPRFRYAMYQLALRWSGRSGGSPWRVILLVLLMPLVQGVLIKVIQWLAKGRLPVQPSQISSGVRSLFSMAKSNPNEGVPTGIPGISPDMPKPEDAPVVPPPKFGAPPSTAGKAAPVSAASIPNPFTRYPKAKPAAQPAAPPAPVPTSTKPSNEPVQRKQRRPRLQRPDEVMSDVGSEAAGSGYVVLPDQVSAA
jgi:hypothetical protein